MYVAFLLTLIIIPVSTSYIYSVEKFSIDSINVDTIEEYTLSEITSNLNLLKNSLGFNEVLGISSYTIVILTKTSFRIKINKEFLIDECQIKVIWHGDEFLQSVSFEEPSLLQISTLTQEILDLVAYLFYPCIILISGLEPSTTNLFQYLYILELSVLMPYELPPSQVKILKALFLHNTDYIGGGIRWILGVDAKIKVMRGYPNSVEISLVYIFNKATELILRIILLLIFSFLKTAQKIRRRKVLTSGLRITKHSMPGINCEKNLTNLITRMLLSSILIPFPSTIVMICFCVADSPFWWDKLIAYFDLLLMMIALLISTIRFNKILDRKLSNKFRLVNINLEKIVSFRIMNVSIPFVFYQSLVSLSFVIAFPMLRFYKLTFPLLILGLCLKTAIDYICISHKNWQYYIGELAVDITKTMVLSIAAFWMFFLDDDDCEVLISIIILSLLALTIILKVFVTIRLMRLGTITKPSVKFSKANFASNIIIKQEISKERRMQQIENGGYTKQITIKKHFTGKRRGSSFANNITKPLDK